MSIFGRINKYPKLVYMEVDAEEESASASESAKIANTEPLPARRLRVSAPETQGSEEGDGTHGERARHVDLRARRAAANVRAGRGIAEADTDADLWREWAARRRREVKTAYGIRT